MKKFLKIASFLFLLVSFIGCKPEVKVKPKTGSIQGKVVYENENVTDYSGIQVTLFSTNGLMATDYCVSRGIATNARSVESVGITNAAGEYFFENVPEGVYTIYASSNSSTKKAVATNVVVRAAETVTAEELGLTATGSISGKITIDYSTVDVLGLDVFIAGTSFIAKVGNDGRYEISNIPAKRGYVLCVQKGEKTIQLNGALEVKADSITNLGTKNMSSKEWETASFKWLGSFNLKPTNPKLYEAYFDTTDGCSYIWNGSNWDLLAQAGKDGADGTNGKDGEDGNDGVSINWRGNYSDSRDIDNPQYLDAYFNTTDGCSYIWNGYSWELLVQKGADGISIRWLGSYSDSSYIYDPQYLDAYFNTTDGCSYIYTNYGWTLLAQKGDNGIDGKGINWLGNYAYAYEIDNPQYLDAYFNTTDGCSYIYTNNGWTLLAQKGDAGTDGIDGTDGASINWRGSYASCEEIEEPQYLDAYFNTTDGCSYIYSNNGWELLAQKGDAGTDGKTINWLGSYSDSSEISEPQLLWAYYNITDGCSYIYNGNEWQLLTRKGTDGVTGSGDGGIRWLGTFDSEYEIYDPVAMDAYFNAYDGCSYIYNGTYWVMLARAGADGLDGIDGMDGTDGEDGTSINWRGSHSSANDVYNPQYMDAYWNTTENCAYIYNGYSWTVLIKGPASGGTGSSSSNIGSEVGANVVGTVLIGWDNPSEVVRIPNGVTDIAENVFKNKDNITRVIIPSSVENIGISAFYDCDSLTSVEFLGSGLKNIQQSAFESCGNLVNIILPSSLESIGAYAFRYDSKLTTVNIPDSVVSIQSEAYAECTMLRTLTFGSGLTTLNYRTFYDCDALINVTIPNSIIKISETVFYHCSALSVLNINGTWKYSYNGDVYTETELKISYFQSDDSYNPPVWTRVIE